MTAAGWVLLLGGVTAAGIVVWPTDGTRWSIRTRTASRARVRRGVEILVEVAAAAVVILVLVAIGQPPAVAASAALPAAVCVSAMMVVVAARRWCDTAEAVARLSAVLANQAAVAVTAADALRRAAPLVSGPVGEAALSMAEDCETVGQQAAAEGFAARVDTEAAQSLADLVAVSSSSGGKWAAAAAVLETEASQAAATARLFRSRVAGSMPAVVVTLALGVGIVVGAAWTTRDVAHWLFAGDGTSVLLAASLMCAAVCARVILPARAQARSGGAR